MHIRLATTRMHEIQSPRIYLAKGLLPRYIASHVPWYVAGGRVVWLEIRYHGLVKFVRYFRTLGLHIQKFQKLYPLMDRVSWCFQKD